MPLLIGTAGYVYPHWRKGAFYPLSLSPSAELSHYLSHYPTLEINSTYHAFPRHATLARWRHLAPACPTFFLKAPAAITHHKRLRAASADILAFCALAADALADRLAGLLFQCPPSLRYDAALLRDFLRDVAVARERAPVPFRVALDLRAPDWFRPDVYAALDDADVALVDNVAVCDRDFAALDRRTFPRRNTPGAAWTYTRFHGSKAPGVCTSFPDEILRAFARGVEVDKEAYAFFMNDREAEAPRDARRLAELVAEEKGLGVREVLGGFAPAWTRKKRDIASFFAVKEKRVEEGKGDGKVEVEKVVQGEDGPAKKVCKEEKQAPRSPPRTPDIKARKSGTKKNTAVALSKKGAKGRDITSYFSVQSEKG